jgi:type VI protein secretion system component Hcp
MEKKKTRKASKSVKNLPVKTASATAAKRVKGGDRSPNENISLNYGEVKWVYTQQK